MASRRDIVVVGASAGGMEALQKLVASLPADLPASVFIVWHLSPGLKSILPSVLNRAGPLKALHPRDGDKIERGRIFVAPNDHHMLLEQGYIRITKGPKEIASGRRWIRCSARRRTSTARASSAWCSRARSTTAPPACTR